MATRTPNSSRSPTRPHRLMARERDRSALEMRLKGMTFAAIGAEMGVSWQAAHQAVLRSLEATKSDIAERAQELRAMEAERLEKITEVLWPKVLEGDLRAIDRVLRTRESFRRLTGIDLQPENTQDGPEFILIETRRPDERGEVIDAELVALPAGIEAVE